MATLFMPANASIEATFTIDPPPLSRMAAMTDRVPSIVPIWFTAITRVMSSSEVVSSEPM